MNNEFLLCNEDDCREPVKLGWGGYCVTHGMPPEPVECKRDGCENNARSLVNSFCSHNCQNIALEKMAQKLIRN